MVPEPKVEMEHYGTTLDLLPFSGYEDLSEVIRETNKNGDHTKILRVIQERKLSLVSHVKHGENDESIMLLRKLLVDVVNGHKIVKAILDNCVGETCEEEDSIDFAIKIDWSGMFTRHENHQTALSSPCLAEKISAPVWISNFHSPPPSPAPAKITRDSSQQS